MVPDGIDDPSGPAAAIATTGGSAGPLPPSAGRSTSARWPAAGRTRSRAAVAGLAGVLAVHPDGAVVLIDGLIASAVPQVLVPAASGCGWSCWCTCRWTLPSQHSGAGTQEAAVLARPPR